MDQSLIIERLRGVIVKVVTFMPYKIYHEHELAANPLLTAYLMQLLSSQLVIKVIYCRVRTLPYRSHIPFMLAYVHNKGLLFRPALHVVALFK